MTTKRWTSREQALAREHLSAANQALLRAQIALASAKDELLKAYQLVPAHREPITAQHLEAGRMFLLDALNTGHRARQALSTAAERLNLTLPEEGDPPNDADDLPGDGAAAALAG